MDDDVRYYDAFAGRWATPEEFVASIEREVARSCTVRYRLRSWWLRVRGRPTLADTRWLLDTRDLVLGKTP